MTARAQLVGVNHVALEVGDLEQALAFYARVFDVDTDRIEREPGMAFIPMGDQFLNLTEGRSQPSDQTRHFGLVVDDKEAARAALHQAGAEILPGHRLDFRDPWGNRVQVVDYRDIKFTKAPTVLHGMGLDGLDKRAAALRELREDGLLPKQGRSPGDNS